MKIIEGDILKLALAGNFDVIVHGCDCYGGMGGGIAKSIRREFPEAFAADNETVSGDTHKLGSYSSATVTRNSYKITVVNAYTQPHWKGQGMLVNYDAITSVMNKIKVDFSGQRIGYPRIGAGLARGDWTVISHIIDTALAGEDHALVDFKG